MYTKMSINLVTISQHLVWSLLFGSTQKNSHNLISYIEKRINLIELETITFLNQAFSIISADLLVYFWIYTLEVLL